METKRHYQRYAIYYAPLSTSDLGRFGNSWLGRDPETGIALPWSSGAQVSAEHITEITTTPSKYGFHATLKAPFYLKAEHSVDDLDQALMTLASELVAVDCGQPALKRLGNFLALVPTDRHEALNQIAATCVRQLDHLRAELSLSDLKRRRQANLTPKQDGLLQKWGYPYVMDEFRFHMTLTGKLDDVLVETVSKALNDHFAQTGPLELILDQICLFGDPGGGGRFDLLKRYPFS